MSQILIQNLDFTYDGDHTPVFERLNLQWDTDWKLGLVGRNGRGKTTLLRLLEGSLEGKGTLIRPERPLYVPKPVRDPQRPARDVLMDGVPEEDEWKLLRELNKLGLGEELLERPFDRLSGGEQTRARLAALFLQEDGYPMIDEPTNHLDEAAAGGDRPVSPGAAPGVPAGLPRPGLSGRLCGPHSGPEPGGAGADPGELLRLVAGEGGPGPAGARRRTRS